MPSGPVLILAPQGRDSDVAASILSEAGIRSHVCESLEQILAHLDEASSAIVAEEALLRAERKPLADWIAAQPAWSDFPFVLLTFREGAADGRLVDLLGNVSILERPFHPSVLVSAVRFAVRARERQRDIALHLEERSRAEEHRDLLIRELHHRVKNTLAIVQALMRATASSALTADEFQRVFSDRVMSLSRTHDLLLASGWQSAPLREILWNELGPFETQPQPRITLTGPDIELRSQLAVPFGMAVHELATNAAKYGSLSVPEGRLEAGWHLEGGKCGAQLVFRWIEGSGPPAEHPKSSGFGSSLIQRVLTGVGGNFTLEFAPSGLRFHLRLPLGQTVEAQELEPSGTAAYPDQSARHGGGPEDSHLRSSDLRHEREEA